MLVYLNGRTLPRDQAMLPVEDRGTMFGDGVYEVINCYQGRSPTMPLHLARLRRSLAGIRLPEPKVIADLPALTDELVRQNGLTDARIYWQITRGPSPRAHLPPADPTPSVLVMCDPQPPLRRDTQPHAWRAITHEDLRWSCCWIKSLMLLPNTLAKDEARRAGCHEALLHRGDIITEGGSTNAFIVLDGALWTHPADQWILPGITRGLVLDLARRAGLTVREQAFTVDQLRQADEVMVTGTTTRIASITHVDQRPIGAGAVGPVARQLHAMYVESILAGGQASETM